VIWSERPVNRPIIMDASTYRILFQVTKELPNLPDRYLSRTDLTRENVDRIVNVARGLRSELHDDGHVQIAVAEPIGELFTCRKIADGPDSDLRSDVPTMAVSLNVMRSWRSLLLGVVEWQKGRELFLRTGYTDEEVLGVVDRLAM
jgi:hypothetical protein